jgi:hypothetical protein
MSMVIVLSLLGSPASVTDAPSTRDLREPDRVGEQEPGGAPAAEGRQPIQRERAQQLPDPS